MISNEYISDYILVQIHFSDFNDKAAQYIAEGWVVYGQPIVASPYVYQAFAMYEDYA